MNALHEFFSHICGQQHCWIIAGQALPFCQRCTGLYIGAFCALLLILVLRVSPNRFLYWLHGVFLLLMVPFGFHMIGQGGMGRTTTGALFGFGLVYYLALNPFTAWQRWKPNNWFRTAVYLLLIGFVITLLLLVLGSDDSRVAFGLTGMGLLGLAGLMLLLVLNLVVLPASVKSLRSHIRHAA